MGVSELTLKLLFLFLPGIITLFIIDTTTVHERFDGWRYSLYSFALGLMNYLLWKWICSLPFIPLDEVHFFQSMRSEGMAINYSEVAWVSLLSVVTGAIISYLLNKRLIYKLLRKIWLTNKSGSVDVWNYILDSDNTDFIAVRDYKLNLMYVGRIDRYSNTTPEREELFLIDVKVYNNMTAELNYEVPAMYLSAKRGALIIEFPYLKDEVASLTTNKRTSPLKEGNIKGGRKTGPFEPTPTIPPPAAKPQKTTNQYPKKDKDD